MNEHAAFSAGSLLRALVEGRVRFVVIGGLAAQAHGSPLITEDLDICFDLDLESQMICLTFAAHEGQACISEIEWGYPD